MTQNRGHDPSLPELPASLASEYRLVARLAEGGEGTLYVAASLADGSEWVVKLYRDDVDQLDTDVLARISQPDLSAHVATMAAYGHDGVWYEVMEYLRGGTLADLTALYPDGVPADLLREVLTELHRAVSAINAAGVVHRAVNPANVLVRDQNPLDLVLVDFGAATDLNEPLRWDRPSTEAAYQPIEALIESGAVTENRDYYSVGMIVYEMLLGENPLATPDRRAATHLAAQDPDLDDIHDEMWARLLEGLLSRDVETRWGAGEVEAWLEGRPPARRRGTRRVTPFQMAGVSYADPLELVDGFARNWAAARRVVQDRSLPLLGQWLADHGDAEAAGLTEQLEKERRPINYRVAAMISLVNPGQVPTFEDVSVAARDLAGVASAARTAGHSSDAGRQLRALFDDRVLSAYRPTDRRLAEWDDEWRAETRTFEELADAVGSELGSLDAEAAQRRDHDVRCNILAATASSVVRTRLRARAAIADKRVPRRDPVFERLRDAPKSIARDVAIVNYAEVAAKRHELHSARQRRRFRESNREAIGIGGAAFAAGARRYFRIAVWFALLAVPLAGEYTYSGDGRWRRAALVIGALALGAVLIAALADYAVSFVQRRRVDPVPSWVYWLGAVIGVGFMWSQADLSADWPTPTGAGWAMLIASPLVTHVVARVPDSTPYGRDDHWWERAVAVVIGVVFGGALLAVMYPAGREAWAVLDEYFAGDDPADPLVRWLVPLVFWGGIVAAHLLLSWKPRWQDRGIYRVLGWALLAAAVVWVSQWDRIDVGEVALLMAWVGTGVQLNVRGRSPRTVWVALGAFALWFGLMDLVVLLRDVGWADAGWRALLIPLTWSAASLRLIGVGLEELV